MSDTTPPRRQLSVHDITGLDIDFKEAAFVIEYCKDFSPRRAAEASGFKPTQGAKLLDKPAITEAINRILAVRLDSSHIDAEWCLMELADNHGIARQRGNLSASNTALGMIMKHTFVDAVASDKLNLNVNADKETFERLQRGRDRAAIRNNPPELIDVSKKDVRFIDE